MEYSELRPPQQKAVSMLRAAWKYHDNHLINMPCGAGKTALASYLAKSLAAAGQKVVFVAPYTTLVDQTYDRFLQYGHKDVSVIWRDDPRYDPKCLIQIASADTIIRREWPNDCKVLIWDESHRAKKKLTDLMKSGEFKTIGLSATPFAKWMGKYYTNLLKPVTTRELVDLGWLTPFEIYAPYVPDTKNAKYKINEFGEKDFSQEYASEIMGDAKLVGNILKNWLENGQNLPTIGFAPSVSTANAYTVEFRQSGVPCEVVTADTPREERQEIFKRFAQGTVKVLWNVGVLGAGFDSDVRCIIWARPTKSEIVWLQGTMRGARPANGKTVCLLFDHSGTYLSLGDPCDTEYYELMSDDEDSVKKVEKAKEEKKEKIGHICSVCNRAKEVGEYQCKKCGHKPLAGEFIDGIAEDRDIAPVNKKDKKKTAEEKNRFWLELKGYQRMKAAEGKIISDGYLSHTYKDWCGVFPRNMPIGTLAPSVTTLNYIKHKQIRFAKGSKYAHRRSS